VALDGLFTLLLGHLAVGKLDTALDGAVTPVPVDSERRRGYLSRRPAPARAALARRLFAASSRFTFALNAAISCLGT
jgi:hypothetical protein